MVHKRLLLNRKNIYSIKLIFRDLYALFSIVKKTYTANQNAAQLFSQVDVKPINHSVDSVFYAINIVDRLHSNSFSDLAAFYRRLLQVFL